jgi:hypothetical protein
MVESAKEDGSAGSREEGQKTTKRAHNEESFWDASRVLFTLLDDIRGRF